MISTLAKTLEQPYSTQTDFSCIDLTLSDKIRYFFISPYNREISSVYHGDSKAIKPIG